MKKTTALSVVLLVALSNFALAEDSSYKLNFYYLKGGGSEGGEVLIQKGMNNEELALALSHSSTSRDNLVEFAYPLSKEDVRLIEKKDQDQLISVMIKIHEKNLTEEVEKGKSHVIAIGERDRYNYGSIINNEKKGIERISRRETSETLDFRSDTPTFTSKVEIFTYPGYVLREQKIVCRPLVGRWQLTGQRMLALFGTEQLCE